MADTATCKTRVDDFQLIEQEASLAKRITPTLPFIVADLVFCAGNEMVVHLEDLLRRRIPLLILAKMTLAELRYLAEIVARTLDWDEATLNNELGTPLHCPCDLLQWASKISD